MEGKGHVDPAAATKVGAGGDSKRERDRQEAAALLLDDDDLGGKELRVQEGGPLLLQQGRRDQVL